MARTIDGQSDKVVSVEEFIDYVSTNVDLRDLDSIAAAAPMLRAVANDRRLVVDRLNRQVVDMFSSDTIASAQVVFLGQGKDFFLRANIWPSLSDLSGGRVYQDKFSYDMAHDHNYSFLTVGYHGPGYTTEIYEYDHHNVAGEVGEHVDLRFLERVHFRTGMVMLYEASRDVHTQHPPEDMSVTMNLMISTPEVSLRDQYFFDLRRNVLLDYPQETDSSRRVSVLKMAVEVGDANTQQLLEDLSRSHPSRRTRLAAYQGLAKLSPEQAHSIWIRATADAESLVSGAARVQLDVLNQNRRAK